MSAFSKGTVLVVDDTEANVDVLVEALGDEYEILVAMDGLEALATVAEACKQGQPPDLILLDIMMPNMDGHEVCTRLQADPTTAAIPIIFLTAMTDIQTKTKAFRAGAVDYVTKPFEILEVKARTRTHLELARARRALSHQNEILEEQVRARTAEVTRTQEVTIRALASLAETRDNETGGHIKRTQNYVRALATRLRAHFGLSERDVDLLYKSAPLHDIGKVGVRDEILLKPGRLTAEEFTEMRRHAELGARALELAEDGMGETDSSFLRFAKEIARGHHERWDGKGYPHGLAGAAIPVSARLMALADVYDALISRRVYKPPFSHAEAVRIILAGRGTQFDSVVVDAFLELHETFRQIALRHADSDEERQALGQPWTDRAPSDPHRA